MVGGGCAIRPPFYSDYCDMHAQRTPLRAQSSTKPLLGMNGKHKAYLLEAALSAWALLRAVSSRCMAATVWNISS